MSNHHYHESRRLPGRNIRVTGVGSGPYGYRQYHHHSIFPAHDPLCCCLGVTAAIAACTNPDIVKALIVAAVAVVIIACLATLAMSVTAEALLSVLLIAAIVGGIACLCQGNNCCQPQSQNGGPRNV